MSAIKISIKLGLWFFICIVLIETFSMILLHSNLVHSQVHQELQSLQARGNSHRDVLEINADQSTVHHIGVMESHTDTDVVITNMEREIILSSGKVDTSMQVILNKSIQDLPKKGRILQSDWKNEKYISTVTAFYQNGKKTGYVYMFKNTDEVQKLISQLNKHFILASLLIIFFILITTYFLSKALKIYPIFLTAYIEWISPVRDLLVGSVWALLSLSN